MNTFCEMKTTAREKRRAPPPAFISQKVSIKSFCKSQSQHKFVILFFILVIVKDTPGPPNFMHKDTIPPPPDLLLNIPGPQLVGPKSTETALLLAGRRSRP